MTLVQQRELTAALIVLLAIWISRRALKASKRRRRQEMNRFKVHVRMYSTREAGKQ